MVMNFDSGVPFDPGFIQHISGIVPNLQYFYMELDKYRNFGQKRNQFKIIFPKLEKLIENYIGFYAGCILWAQAIKTLKDKPITGNYCCGGEFSEEETLQEVRFLKDYLNILPRDVKYYMGQSYNIDPKDEEILNMYEEFLKVNEGFVKAKKTDDLVIPECIKPIQNTEKIFNKIEEVIENGKLAELKEYLL